MTLNELYRQGAEMLDYAFVENAILLLKKVKKTCKK